MDEVIKMYAMNDGDSELEPAELNADHDETEEDDDLDSSNVITSSDDDDEVEIEEGVIIAEVIPDTASAPKRAPAKKAAKLRRRRLPQRKLRPKRQRRKLLQRRPQRSPPRRPLAPRAERLRRNPRRSALVKLIHEGKNWPLRKQQRRQQRRLLQRKQPRRQQQKRQPRRPLRRSSFLAVIPKASKKARHSAGLFCVCTNVQDAMTPSARIHAQTGGKLRLEASCLRVAVVLRATSGARHSPRSESEA